MRFERPSASAGEAQQQVLVCGDLRVGRFFCPPKARAWREDNRIGGGALMVVPHRRVEIRQAGAQTVHAHAGQAVFYAKGQIYRRRLVDPRGDACVFVHVGASRWPALARHAGLGEAVDPDAPFPFQRGPLAPTTYRAFCALINRLVCDGIEDPLELEAALLPLVDATLRAAAEASGRRTPQRAAHAALADRAEALLSARYRENLSLDALAEALDTSAAHLARVFQRHTGRSLHQYRLALRLASSLRLLADPDRSVTDVALELGFASPSHFATAVRRTFGAPPSALRQLGACARDTLSERVNRAGI